MALAPVLVLSGLAHFASLQAWPNIQRDPPGNPAFQVPAPMHYCPHCSARTIGTWRKVTATPFSPAICPACGKASLVSAWRSFAAALAAEVLFWGSLVLAILLGSVYGLLALPLGLLVVSFLLARLFPLIPADDRLLETRRKVVRRAWGVVLVGVLLLAVFAGIPAVFGQ